MGVLSSVSFEVIDTEHLRSFTGDDVDLIAEVFSLFRNQADLWVKIVDPQADKQQWINTHHTLRGAANAIGAKAVGTACAEAEESFDNSSVAARSEAIHRTKACISGVLEEIARWEYRQGLADLRKPSHA